MKPCQENTIHQLASDRALGLNADEYGEFLAVVGLYNQFNKLVDGLQVEPDVTPDASWPG